MNHSRGSRFRSASSKAFIDFQIDVFSHARTHARTHAGTARRRLALLADCSSRAPGRCVNDVALLLNNIDKIRHRTDYTSTICCTTRRTTNCTTSPHVKMSRSLLHDMLSNKSTTNRSKCNLGFKSPTTSCTTSWHINSLLRICCGLSTCCGSVVVQEIHNKSKQCGSNQ